MILIILKEKVLKKGAQFFRYLVVATSQAEFYPVPGLE